MKNCYTLLLLCLSGIYLNAQTITPFGRVYTILNTQCQNNTCHSATAADGSESLRFDGTANEVHAALYNVASSNPNSVAKFEKLVKPQHPYYSFLLRKIAGASFDTDLAIDANEGALMQDINGNQLSNKEIEFIRQWIMFGAKKSYGSSDPKPDWQLVSDYYDDTLSFPFIPKPAKPAAGTGVQLRMGPIFMPKSGSVEQEWLEQQEVNFPYPVEIDRIAGFMNQQSHHFLLFKFSDTTAAVDAAADRNENMQLVSIIGFNSSFDGDKLLTGGWQDDAELILPQGTAMFWDQKVVLDMNYHVKNYSTSAILPADFYFNVYYKPRNPNTIEMKTNLVNNATLFLMGNSVSTRDYDDPENRGGRELRYLWNMTSHSHKYGIDYDIYIRDTTGAITDKIYEGFYDYANGGIDKGYYDWEHPSTKVWPDLLPVHFGKHNGNNSGVVARTTWDVTQSLPVTFGFTTNDEMQLFYYNYTSELPSAISSINDDTQKGIYFQVMPNPMNNDGKLVYTLDKTSVVEANVVDITGKKVALLTEQKQEEGVHEITLGNSKLSAGIYFARLSVNGAVYTKKFIVTE